VMDRLLLMIWRRNFTITNGVFGSMLSTHY
jgi:hypothetical protein